MQKKKKKTLTNFNFLFYFFFTYIMILFKYIIIFFIFILFFLFLLGRWDLENYWSLCLPPSVGQVVGCLTRVLLVFALLLRLSALGEHLMGGTCGRHSDAQVSKAGDRYLDRCTVINDVPFSLKCVLFILF